MSQAGQEQPTQGHGEDQEPLVLGDRYGIVVVWPDRYVRRFSWEALRQGATGEDGPPASRSPKVQVSKTRKGTAL